MVGSVAVPAERFTEVRCRAIPNLEIARLGFPEPVPTKRGIYRFKELNGQWTGKVGREK